MIIHQEEYIQVHIDYLLNHLRLTEYEMITYETIHIPTRGE